MLLVFFCKLTPKHRGSRHIKGRYGQRDLEEEGGGVAPLSLSAEAEGLGVDSVSLNLLQRSPHEQKRN